MKFEQIRKRGNESFAPEFQFFCLRKDHVLVVDGLIVGVVHSRLHLVQFQSMEVQENDVFAEDPADKVSPAPVVYENYYHVVLDLGLLVEVCKDYVGKDIANGFLEEINDS